MNPTLLDLLLTSSAIIYTDLWINEQKMVMLFFLVVTTKVYTKHASFLSLLQIGWQSNIIEFQNKIRSC